MVVIFLLFLSICFSLFLFLSVIFYFQSAKVREYSEYSEWMHAEVERTEKEVERGRWEEGEG